MLMLPIGYDGGQQRLLGQGDTPAKFAIIVPAVTTANINPVLGGTLLQQYIKRNAAGNSADVLDTAENIRAAVQSILNGPVPDGISWGTRVINLAAQTITYTAPSNGGVTVVSTGSVNVINNSSVKDFLCSFQCAAPLSTHNLTTVNGSAILTVDPAALQQAYPPAGLAKLRVGMVVTNAVAGQQGNTIIGINIAAGTVTMSGNSNANNTTPVAVTFSPTFTFEGVGQGLL